MKTTLLFALCAILFGCGGDLSSPFDANGSKTIETPKGELQ